MDEKTLLAAIGAMMDEKLEPIKADITELKQDVRKIDQRAMRIEKEHGSRINGMYESIVGTGEKFTRLEKLEGRVEHLEDDVFALKQAK